MRRTRQGIARIAAAAVVAAAPTPAATPVAAGAGAAAIVVSVEVARPQVAHADNVWLHSCAFYGNDDVSHGVWLPQQAYTPDPDFSDTDNCGSGSAFGVHTTQAAWGGHWEQWLTVAPAGISIDSAWTPPCTWSNNCQFGTWHGTLINCKLASDGYTAWYVWGSSGSPAQIVNHDGGNCYSDGLSDGTPINTGFPPTNYFGFQLRCSEPSNKTCPALTPGVGLTGVQVGATETRAPSIGPASASSSILFNHNGGWVRGGGSGGGGFDVGMAGWDPSGLCDMRASLNGQLIQGPTTSLDQSVWDQCDDTGASQQWAGPTIDTTQYADGTALQLSYQADNAAGNWATSATSTSHVDNSQVSLSLGGPSDTPVTAEPAYVTATSSSNPSGDTISCQTDGGTWGAHGGTSARIAVSGLGEHHVSCYSQDGAQDNNGQPGRSPTESWSLKIGEPVDAHISLSKIRLKCRLVRVRKHHRIKRVRRCAVITHDRRVEQVGYGRRVTVTGSVATANHIALAGVPVSILAAPNNGQYRWRTVKVVTTAADGNWRATLPPGPSRLIEAFYGGGPYTEAATSRPARTIVRAKIELGHVPARVPWGGAIVIRGRVLGGYIPGTPPEQILQLQSGVGRHLQVVGNPTIRRNGRFVITVQASGSGGPQRTQIAIATLHEANYPYAPGVSRRVWITVG
jgi:hypothetical protein